MNSVVIGVFTRRIGSSFIEPLFFKGLHDEGKKLGALIYFFSEEDIRHSDKRIDGFTPNRGGHWIQRSHPWPDIVIDRRRSRWTPTFKRIRKQKLFPYASSKFASKGTATHILANTDKVRQWIPATAKYSTESLAKFMDEFPLVYVKPGNGTGGGSVVRIARNKGNWIVWGRKRTGALQKAHLTTRKQVYDWLARWGASQRVRGGSFIVQQGLNLELIPNRVVDCRLLIQKNRFNQWELTGIAARIGGPRSPTTNLLYGDGKARKFDHFMIDRFGMQKASEIREECVKMAFAVVEAIESRYGPMMEFGMDVGIDTDGRVWLIEANPKPSRDVFLKTGERSIYTKALRRPIEYAMFLAAKSSSD